MKTNKEKKRQIPQMPFDAALRKILKAPPQPRKVKKQTEKKK